MSFSLGTMMGLARDTVLTPRPVARQIMAMGLGRDFAWLALFLMAIGSALLTHLSLKLGPDMVADQDALAMAVQARLDMIMGSPIRLALMQGAVMVVSVFLVHGIGLIHRKREASLAEAILLISWLQFILLCAQAVQLVALLVLPPLAEVIGLAGMVLFFWVISNFVAELHGYRSAFLALLAVFGLLLLMGIVLAILLAMFLGPFPEGV